MLFKSAINQALIKLKKIKVSDPHLEAELLLSDVLKKPREYILAHEEKRLTKLQIKNYILYITKRQKGVPLSYITGQKEFYGLDFTVNKNVLIPRPETELMVDESLSYLTHNMEHGTIIDIGTGSGCIIISLIKALRSGYSELSSFRFFASDISKPTLNIARKNAKIHDVHNHITFLHGNLLEPFLKNKKFLLLNSNYLLLANLPYLNSSDIKQLPTIKYEPRLALDGGSDGLEYYRQLLKQIKRLNNILRFTCYVLCEIDPNQTTNMKKLIKVELPNSKIQTKKDLKGHNRLMKIKINHNS